MNNNQVIDLNSPDSKPHYSRSISTKPRSRMNFKRSRPIGIVRQISHVDVIDLTTVDRIPDKRYRIKDDDSDCMIIDDTISLLKSSSEDDEIEVVKVQSKCTKEGQGKNDIGVKNNQNLGRLKADPEEVANISSSNAMNMILTTDRLIQEVRVIFPRMDHNYIIQSLKNVQSKYSQQSKDQSVNSSFISARHQCSAEVISRQDFANLVTFLSQHESYPKEADEKLSSVLIFDYANDASYERGEMYKLQSYQKLLTEWPFLSKEGVTKILQRMDGRYYKSYMFVLDMIKETKEDISEQHNEVLRLKRGGRITALQKTKFVIDMGNLRYSIALKAPRNKSDVVRITDAILLDEVKEVDKKWNEWVDQVEKFQSLKKARLKAEEQGTLVECTCCFGDYAPEEMVCCIDGHVFCQGCLRKYAEEQVFGLGSLGGDKRSELKCMCLDGCEGFFSRNHLEMSLDEKVLKKYDELQAALVLRMSGLQGLNKCTNCYYQAIVPEFQKVFSCPQCGFESCIECGEEAHIPLKCSEIEKKGETSARLSVEEAMTKARVRYCPKGCKQPFFKVEGCNKMTCPTCRIFICYTCREEIPKKVGYTHFCQKPHCDHKSCKKCLLYSNSEQDDLQAAKDAGLSVIQSLKADPSSNGDEVAKRMEESILKDGHFQQPPAAKTTMNAAPLRVAHVRLLQDQRRVRH